DRVAGAEVGRDDRLGDRLVGGSVRRVVVEVVEIVLAVDVGPLDIGQDHREERRAVHGGRQAGEVVAFAAGGEGAVAVVVGVHRQAHLPQVVEAGGAGRRFTYFLHRGDQQCHENRDDRDDHQ